MEPGDKLTREQFLSRWDLHPEIKRAELIGGIVFMPSRKYLAGRAEFLTEICRSSASYDLHVKLDLYQAAGIPEYLAILVYEQEIRWHVLRNGKYLLLPPDPDGIHRSLVFPGLWFDGTAMLARNLKQVLPPCSRGSPRQNTRSSSRTWPGDATIHPDRLKDAV